MRQGAGAFIGVCQGVVRGARVPLGLPPSPWASPAPAGHPAAADAALPAQQ